MNHEYGSRTRGGFYIFYIFIRCTNRRLPKTLQGQEMNCTVVILHVLVRLQQESIWLWNSRGLENKARNIPINILASLIPHAGMSLFTACHLLSFKWFIQGWWKCVYACSEGANRLEKALLRETIFHKSLKCYMQWKHRAYLVCTVAWLFSSLLPTDRHKSRS